MNKKKALVLVAISVIALGGGVNTVSNASAATITSPTVLAPTDTVDNSIYDYQELATSGITSSLVSKYEGDNLADPSDASVKDSIDKYGNVTFIPSPYTTVNVYGSMDIDDGVYDRTGWVSWDEVNSGAIGIYSKNFAGTDQTTMFLPSENIDNSHYVEYNNIGVISDGTSYEYIDVKMIPHVYLTQGDIDAKAVGIAVRRLPEAATVTAPLSIIVSFYAENVIFDFEVTYSDGYVNDTNENDYQDNGETITSFGYANAGSTISGGVNMYISDLDGTNYIAIDDEELEKVRIPYCDIADIPTSPDGGETIDTTDPCYSLNFDYAFYNDGTDYTHASGDDILDRRRSTLTDLDLITQRLKVYFDSSVPGTTKHVIFDSWALNPEPNDLPSQDIQIQTKDGEFQLESGFQTQWLGYDTITDAYVGPGFVVESVKADIIIADKKQTDAGVGFDNTTGVYGDGSLDGVAAPNESILYTISVTNAGYVTDENYTVTDTIADEFEDIDFTNVNVVSMALSDYEGFELAGEIPPVGQMCSSVTCTTLSEGTDYIIDKTNPRKIDVTLTTPIEQQTAYLVQFEVKVKADYGGLSDNTLSNTAQICDSTASCFTTPEITLPYGDIALKIDKAVNDTADSTYVPSDGIKANGDTYASSEEWLNYTIAVTNSSTDGATVPAQNVNIVDDISLDTNLEKIDPATIVVTSSIHGDITSSCDTSFTTTTLNVTVPLIAVDEQIIIRFKAKVA